MAKNRIFQSDSYQRMCPPHERASEWTRVEKRQASTRAPPAYQPNWETALRAALAQSGRVARLEREVLVIKDHCKKLRDGQSMIVPVETLAPEPFVLKRPFHVVVRPSDGAYEATFFDANIGMVGDTEAEAVQNLKLLIVDTFEMLESNEAVLGTEPTLQLAVLRELIQKQS
jgi:hypothetical protein